MSWSPRPGLIASPLVTDEADTTDDPTYEPEPRPAPADVALWVEEWSRKPRITRQTLALRAYREAFARESLTFDDLGPLASIATYRIVRARLHLLGHLMLDESLEATRLPWNTPAEVKNQAHLTPADEVNFEQSLAALAKHPAPLLPSCANGTLRAWTAQTRALASDLRIDKPSRAYPFASMQVIRLLTKPEALASLWPTAKQLLEVQGNLLRETFTLIGREGHISAATHLMDHYGFTWSEATSLVALAKAAAVAVFKGSPEQERALSVARAEDVMKRSGGAFDRRGELNATKQIGLFVGVTRSEVEDVQVEFAKLAQKMSNVQIPLRPATIDVTPAAPSIPAQD